MKVRRVIRFLIKEIDVFRVSLFFFGRRAGVIFFAIDKRLLLLCRGRESIVFICYSCAESEVIRF